jgi:hypothetical protein
MKIQIVNKKDETDVHMYDLKKALGLHAAKSGNGRTLEIYWPGMPLPMSFPDSKYRFDEIEISMSMAMTAVKRTIPEILGLFALFTK